MCIDEAQYYSDEVFMEWGHLPVAPRCNINFIDDQLTFEIKPPLIPINTALCPGPECPEYMVLKFSAARWVY